MDQSKKLKVETDVDNSCEKESQMTKPIHLALLGKLALLFSLWVMVGCPPPGNITVDGRHCQGAAWSQEGGGNCVEATVRVVLDEAAWAKVDESDHNVEDIIGKVGWYLSALNINAVFTIDGSPASGPSCAALTNDQGGCLSELREAARGAFPAGDYDSVIYITTSRPAGVSPNGYNGQADVCGTHGVILTGLEFGGNRFFTQANVIAHEIAHTFGPHALPDSGGIHPFWAETPTGELTSLPALNDNRYRDHVAECAAGR